MTAQGAVTDTVAKYFFFFSLDEQISFGASLKVLSELKSRNWLEITHRSEWVRTMHKYKNKITKLKGKAWTDSPTQKGFSLPDDLDLSVWVSFLTAADGAEVEAVLLSRILGFGDEEIALGLGLTAGTVRYRVGRGLRHLGGFIEP